MKYIIALLSLLFSPILINCAELRSFVTGTAETRQALENQNALFKGAYAFTDYIYQPKERCLDLNREFIRLRVYQHTNWDQKKCVLVHKVKDVENQTSHLIMQKEFDSFEEAQQNLLGYELLFSFSRTGFEYALDDMRIFVEDIQHLNPSIEIVASSNSQIHNLFARLPITAHITDSVPRRIEKQLLNN